MARQAGPLYLTGTLDEITFYKMEGQYYARKKSSLTKKRFYRDHAFARSRKAAAAFGEAARLASAIYWQLPKEQRGKGVIAKLTSQVGQLLREGKDPNQIIEHFRQQNKPDISAPVSQTQTKEKVVLPTPLSVMKITATGILVIEKMGIDLNSDFIQISLDYHKQKLIKRCNYIGALNNDVAVHQGRTSSLVCTPMEEREGGL